MIELADVIKDLRDELYRAIDGGENERLQFEVGSIELELSVSVEQTDGVQGKVRFWVVDLGADMNDKNISTQKLKLTLTPTLHADGGRITPRVSGEAEDGED
ncbi:trypco2 family protein [Actinoallomurus acaciae]|uniref:Trypco2 family protein n=1 Tax=Actinoallomurus acaciae TaxID=502577 RepID=A0ABV5YVT2_9ACTN